MADPKFDPSSSTIAASTSKACKRSGGLEAKIFRLVVRDALGPNGRRGCHDCVATASGDYAVCPSACGGCDTRVLFVQNALQVRVVICDSSRRVTVCYGLVEGARKNRADSVLRPSQGLVGAGVQGKAAPQRRRAPSTGGTAIVGAIRGRRGFDQIM
jgi:hypothetical protein